VQGALPLHAGRAGGRRGHNRPGGGSAAGVIRGGGSAVEAPAVLGRTAGEEDCAPKGQPVVEWHSGCFEPLVKTTTPPRQKRGRKSSVYVYRPSTGGDWATGLLEDQIRREPSTQVHLGAGGAAVMEHDEQLTEARLTFGVKLGASRPLYPGGGPVVVISHMSYFYGHRACG
jgi:hypothetical protein